MFLDDFAVLILYIDKGCVVVPRHFEFYILKCKNFLIDFLDELGNFKQKKNFTLQNVNLFYSNGPFISL